MRHHSVTSSRLALIVAAFLWSTSGAFTKILALPGPVMAFYRVIFAGAALLPFVPWKKIGFRPALLGMVFCFAGMNLCFVSAMVATSAANAIFLQYTAPVWVFIASVLWLKEPLDRKSVWSGIVAMGGIAVLLSGGATHDAKGIALALASGVFYAGVAVFLRFLRDEVPLWLTTLNLLAGGLLLLPFVWEMPVPSAGKLVGLAIFGVIQMAIPYCLFSYALKGTTAQEAGILTLIEPALNPIWAYLAVGERPAPATMAGGAIILSAVALKIALSRAGRLTRR